MAQKAKVKVNQTKVKVQFRLDPANEQGMETESVWAEPLGADRFRILNSPFYIFGISAEDVVAAEEIAGRLEFREVTSRGGHSTYRVFLQGGRTIRDADFQCSWGPISALGGTFENANDHFVAVDIPSGLNVAEIFKLLEKGEQSGLWAFEEVHYEAGSPQ
jgi:hypothetical protein